ncbi:MAG: hypothetical protein E7322_12920 [Clostridiales bacterium]|nr:hypothetical protein [Clostridiales bacterium]
MKTGIECFAGANTSMGFYSGFDGIFSYSKKTFFIKGAPGTGKSSLMKRIMERQKSLGHVVSAFHCSSDPDSLDGIIDETISGAIIDATAPHTYDPPYPGSTGAILSMGDFLDEGALYKNAEKIESINREMKKAFHSACQYLKSASDIESANEANENARLADALSDEILSDLPQKNGYGTLRTFFLDAYTHKGRISYVNTFDKGAVISVAAPFPAHVDMLLRTIAHKARLYGQNVILFPSPVSPEKISHIYLPDVPLLVTSEALDGAHRTFDAYQKTPVYRPGDKALFDALTEKACTAMADAKRLHDELEEVYIPRMDFSRLIECESRVISAFDGMK